jgi:hypothetical protein
MVHFLRFKALHILLPRKNHSDLLPVVDEILYRVIRSFYCL